MIKNFERLKLIFDLFDPENTGMIHSATWQVFLEEASMPKKSSFVQEMVYKTSKGRANTVEEFENVLIRKEQPK